MKQVELIWVSNSPDWEDVHCQADKVRYENEALRVHYSGATDDEGHYEGQFELALRSGVQSIEGEYTVFPPKGSAEHFNQVVSFGLTGQIKPAADGANYFSGIWDEGGVAQEFKVGPITMSGEAALPAGNAGARAEAVVVSGLPATLQVPAAAMREFELAMAPLAQLVDGVAAFSGFATLFAKLDQLMREVRSRLDDIPDEPGAAEALLGYLRDEASLQLEQLLDQGAMATLPANPAPELAAFVADIEALAENLQVAVMREGYTLCKVWLGLADE
ncbi:hypothetical protein [Chitinimonas naiadis]